MKIHKEAARFALLLFPVGLACAIYLSLMNLTMMRQMGIEASMVQLVLISILQVGLIYTLLLGYLGYQLTQKIGLMKSLTFSLATLKPVLLLSCFTALIMLSDYVLFAPHIPQVMASYDKSSFTLAGLVFNMLYGGIIEEIMLRLFFLSLLVVLLDLIFKRTKQDLPIPSSFYLIANIIAALLFALGHLPATQMAFGTLTNLLILRALLLNGVLGYLFGWAFIKFGIQWAMLTHALTHLISQALFFFLIL